MKADISTIMIEMSLQEAEDLSQEMHDFLRNLSDALSAVSHTETIDGVISQYPTVGKLLRLIDKTLSDGKQDLPF